MPFNMHRLLGVFLLLGTCTGASAFSWQDEEAESISKYYGFSGLEIFKLSRRSANMIKGDFNGDGLLDVLLVDNSSSRLDLLQQRKKGEPDKPSRVNDIKNDWRLEHVKIPVDLQVAGLTSGDLNNDGLTDIAYLAMPDKLVVRYQSKDKKSDWSNRFTVRLPSMTPAQWMMATGDLNNDKLEDVVVLGKTETYLMYQTKDGKLDTPISVMNTSTSLSLLQIADLDGDGLDDLTYLSTEGRDRGLCARMQSATGGLGPELRFDLKRPRSVTLANIDETPETEILTIDTRTGRVGVSRMKAADAKPGELAARLTQYGFGEEGSGKGRDLQIGDINGDGLKDVVMTDPDKAQMLVFLQEKGKGLRQAMTFPGLLGANHIRIADLDGDKMAEVIVMSTKEKVVAVSRYADGRLSFPKSLPMDVAGLDKVEWTPTCLDIVDIDGDGQGEVVCVGNKKEGRKTTKVLTTIVADGDSWKSTPEVPLTFTSEPKELRGFDANNDGKSDLLVFFDLNKPPAILLNVDGKLEPLQTAGGIRLGKLGSENVTISEADGKTGLLVAQDSFARRLMLEDNQWQVVDQYNAAESKAKVEGSVELNLDGEAGNEIVLIDAGVSKLRVLRNTENVFRPWREVELGALEYQNAHVCDLNGDGKEDLLLVGKGQFAVLYTEQADPSLEEIASFETKLERVFFQDLIAGDLNADGLPDMAVLDTRSHMVEILNFDSAKGLTHAIQFKIFEEKSFAADRNAAGVEPREAIIADVTGDGRSDLILLVHDRVLLYPQDSGETPSETPADAAQN